MSENNRILVYLASVAIETRILVCLASVAQQTRSLVQLASSFWNSIPSISMFKYLRIHIDPSVINNIQRQNLNPLVCCSTGLGNGLNWKFSQICNILSTFLGSSHIVVLVDWELALEFYGLGSKGINKRVIVERVTLGVANLYSMAKWGILKVYCMDTMQNSCPVLSLTYILPVQFWPVTATPTLCIQLPLAPNRLHLKPEG